MPDHGTRTHYQHSGCRCVSCRAANAAYTQHLRQTKRQGKIPLYAIISAKDASKLVSALLLERFTRQQLAKQLGISPSCLAQQHLKDESVRFSTVLRLRRLTRMLGQAVPD